MNMSRIKFPEHFSRPAPCPNARAVPLMLCPIVAGWPSPSEDYIEQTLNFHKYLVRNEMATFCLHVSGDSMIGAGIHDGDTLVVDRSIEPASGKIVIAAVEGELTVKRLVRKKGRILLVPENDNYPVIDITEHEDTVIWGVVTFAIHSL